MIYWIILLFGIMIGLAVGFIMGQASEYDYRIKAEEWWKERLRQEQEKRIPR